ncbi:MAG: glucose-1-phosphate thymidylyltransferase, glucose-1-phosphate thymidylyltransferase [Candidatus Peregrinibacteria bacterium GW2011_GWC2_33_13]|nr:MAG: glucose-1-phosphate thymidylyltransferase, glucose-1-phosphate thymidylyltransferase [Candidatus Peregrinibacteria bacterium GW2011_GWC2_33_13]
MKGVILAGGTGSRLYPLTKVTNKHLLPVYNKPMIYFPLETLIGAGLDEIMIVTGAEFAESFERLLGDGKNFNVNLSFAVQKNAGGIAEAISLTEKFANNEKIVVMLGDNIINESIKNAVNDFDKQENGAKIFLKKVDNPNSFGVAEISDGKIINIEEKPKNPKSDLAVIGIYMYDKDVFDVIRTLKPSNRGELEVTDLNNYYVKQGNMSYEILKGWWGDGGESFDSLFRAGEYVRGECSL